jgi:hypothetical protein
MLIFLIQLILGVFLFFIINWIGNHSYSIGYIEVSIFVKAEEAPALNFLIRVLSPIVYIIIVAATFYHFKLDRFVENIYFVNVYYILFRLIFNLVTNRGLLLNWYRQILYWVTILIISYFTYIKLIHQKTNILPDFTSIANELWIIILIFIFQVTNNIRLSQDGTEKRKENYLNNRYRFFKKLYSESIKTIAQNNILEAISYAILIYEDFNRPKLVRFIENIKFRLTKKPHTMGVMQVYTHKFLNDKQSVIKGVNKVVEAYTNYLQNIGIQKDEYYEWPAYTAIISNYNKGDNYTSEVLTLFQQIREKFYKNTTDTLNPNK